MTAKAHPGWHPDADALSAFAEQALLERERGPIVAHLADCPDCREVVFLAQAATQADAAEAVETQEAPASVPWAAPARSGWRSLWPARNWALVVPAAALAAGAALVFWVERPGMERLPHEPGVEQAQSVVPDQPLPNATDHTAPGRQSSATAGKAAALRESPERLAAKKGASAAGRGLQPDQIEALPEPKSLPAPPELTQSAGLAQNEHPPTGFAAGWRPPGTAAEPGRLAMEELPGESATSAGLLPAGERGLSRNALPHNVRMARPAEVVAARAPRSFMLPGGQLSQSAAAMHNCILALDPQGTVYRTTDDGKAWQPVAVQWTGKAVALSTNAVSSLRLADAEAAPGSGNQPIALQVQTAQTPADHENKRTAQPLLKGSSSAGDESASLFKLVTDRQETWVSADGITWRRQ